MELSGVITIGGISVSIFHLLAAIFSLNVVLFLAMALFYRAQGRRIKRYYTETTEASVEAKGRWIVFHYRVYGTPYEKKVQRNARTIQLFLAGKGEAQVRYDPNAPGHAVVAGFEDKAHSRAARLYAALTVFDALAAAFLWCLPALLQMAGGGA